MLDRLRPMFFVLLTLLACSSEAPSTSADAGGDANGGGDDSATPDAGGGVDGGDGGGVDAGDAAVGDAGPRDAGPTGDGGAMGDGGTSPMRPPQVTMCNRTLQPLSSGTCRVTAGSTTLLLTGDVLTPGEVLRGGQVLVDGNGRITCAACDCSAATGAMGATAIECPTGVISPGLINAHDHLTFAQNNPYTRTAERYEHRHDWRRGIRGHTRLSSAGSASNDQVAYGELRFVMGGATAVNGSGGVAGFMRNLDRGTMDGLGQPQVQYETFPLGDSGGELRATGCAYPGIDTAASIMAVDSYTPHVAEGIDPEARNEFTCIRTGANDLVQPNSAFVHGVGLLPSDIAEMGQQGTALIWSPRSNITLYGDTARVTEYARLGVPIALGSDWIISGSMNMLRELQCADTFNRNFLQGFFTDEALWLMATRDAAAALAVDDAIGVIAPGRVADLAIFNGAMRRDHRAVLGAGASDVSLVLRGGAALYGDASIVAMLNGGDQCDPLDVCGTMKRVCVARDLGGRHLSALQSANANRYPLFFCGEPMNEPSCLPERNAMGSLPNPAVRGSNRYSGMSSMADTDGDGVMNDADNCPSVFNPVRPVDNGMQADADMDRVGDACDPCPLTPNSTQCAAPDPNDRDGDGVPNTRDNCPDVRNPEQTDTDSDMTGDACDACPMAANPGGAACPATVYAIKSGMVMLGNRVTVTGPVVTALARNGFYAQVAMGDSAYAGVDNSAIFVFTGTAPMVAVGNRVTLSNATVADYYGQRQLTGATITVTAPMVTLPAVTDVMPADVITMGPRAAALEGALVRVQNVSVLNAAPTPEGGETAPTNEFLITGNLRVDDGLFLSTPFPTMGENFSAITGILAFARSNSKLNPRSADDLVAGAASLLPFPTELVYTRVGVSGAPSFPTQLVAQLARATSSDTLVTVTSSGPGLGVMNLTIPAGQTRVPIALSGVTASATPYTLSATFNGITRTAQVRVLDLMEAPALTALGPAMSTATPGTTVTLTVSLDIPAPPGGTLVTLAAMGGSVPMTVTVPANQTRAEVIFTAGAMTGNATVSATLGMVTRTAMVSIVEASSAGLIINEVDYDQVGTDNGEFIEIMNASRLPIDLTGVALVLVNGSNSTEYARVALSGTLAPGAYAVVANSGVTVPSGVARFNIANDSVQNGAPDGVALINTTDGSLLDALSYEGSIRMATITGVTGRVDLVEGSALASTVADSNTAAGSLARVPNGGDTNDANADWRFVTMPTPGAANPMQ